MPNASSPNPGLSGLRWYIAGVLCLATALNYLDRQALSVLAVTIKTELGISTIGYSRIQTAFLVSYTVMYLVGGRLVDLLGTRRALGIFAAGWSAVSALHALARTALQFGIFRFLLGATEAANFPAMVKSVSEWFPVRERALAVGIANSGSAIGAAVAAPLISWVALTWGWRAAFLASGLIGALWVILWVAFYRAPQHHPLLRDDEKALLASAAADQTPPAAAPPIRRLLSLRETWGCVAARAFTDPITYFFVFWTPLFLQQERGFDLAAIGRYGWIPYVTLALGNLAGGWIPRQLVAAGWALDRSRKGVMAAASIIIAASVVALLHTRGQAVAIGLISTALFCHGAWANMTLPAEVFEKHSVGTVSGLGGAVGALVGALATLLIGWIVQNLSFQPVFLAIALLPGAGWVVVCLLVKDLGRLRSP